MNQFELFSMIYYVLDADWEETKDRDLGDFLSGMNPFLFDDIGSANPEVYQVFCQLIPSSIDKKDSYRLALQFVNSLDKGYVKEAFLTVDEDEWFECLSEYLSAPHKGEE